MALPTQIDYNDMSQMVYYRLMLSSAQRSYEEFPQVFSWEDVIITPATREDYNYSESFEDVAIIVDRQSTQKFCEQMSCNSHIRGGDDCSYNYDKPSAFISYDSTYSQCEPACFLLGDTIDRPDPSKVDTLYTVWSEDEKKCFYGNLPLFMWLTDPQVRSKARWERHVNTLRTGFKATFDGEGKISGKLNEYYCSEFNLILSDNGKECKQRTWEIIASFLPIGSTIISLIESAIRNNWNVEPKPYGVNPDLSVIPETKLNAELWKKHVDDKYVTISPIVRLSELGFDRNMRSLASRGAFYWHNKENSIIRKFTLQKTMNQIKRQRLCENLTFKSNPYKQTIRMRSQRQYLSRENLEKFRKNRIANLKSIIIQNRYKNVNVSVTKREIRECLENDRIQFDAFINENTFNYTTKPTKTPYKDDNADDSTDDDDNNQDDDDHKNAIQKLIDMIGQLKDGLIDIIENLPEMLLDLFTSWENLAGLATSMLYGDLEKMLRSICTKVLDGTLTRFFVQMIDKTSVRILEYSLEHVISVVAVKMASLMVAKLMVLTVKLVVATFDVLEWLDGLIMILDIVWSILDPFGFNKSMGQESIDEVCNIYNDGLKEMGFDNFEITPFLLESMIIQARSKFSGDDYDDQTSKAAQSDVQYNTKRFNQLKKCQMLNLKHRQLRDSESSVNLTFDPDDNVFTLLLCSTYLYSRQTNSLGEAYNWDADAIDKFDYDPPGNTIYNSLISNVNIREYFDTFNYRQTALIVLFIIFILFSVITNLNTLFAIILFILGNLIIFIKYNTNLDMNLFISSTVKNSIGTLNFN